MKKLIKIALMLGVFATPSFSMDLQHEPFISGKSDTYYTDKLLLGRYTFYIPKEIAKPLRDACSYGIPITPCTDLTKEEIDRFGQELYELMEQLLSNETTIAIRVPESSTCASVLRKLKSFFCCTCDIISGLFRSQPQRQEEPIPHEHED